MILPRLARLQDAAKIFELNGCVASTSLVQWSVVMIEEEIVGAQSKVWVIENSPDGEAPLAAFLCACHLTEDQWEIRNLAVAPEHWGKGLAQKLLEALRCYILALPTPGAAEVFLEVAVSNLRAIRFYEKVGAKRLYLRKNLYGSVDGWVFVLKWS